MSVELPKIGEFLRPSDQELGTPVTLEINEPFQQQLLLRAISTRLKHLTGIEANGVLLDGRVEVDFLRNVARQLIPALPERGRPNALECTEMGLGEFVSKEELEKFQRRYSDQSAWPKVGRTASYLLYIKESESPDE